MLYHIYRKPQGCSAFHETDVESDELAHDVAQAQLSADPDSFSHGDLIVLVCPSDHEPTVWVFGVSLTPRVLSECEV